MWYSLIFLCDTYEWLNLIGYNPKKEARSMLLTHNISELNKRGSDWSWNVVFKSYLFLRLSSLFFAQYLPLRAQPQGTSEGLGGNQGGCQLRSMGGRTPWRGGVFFIIITFWVCENQKIKSWSELYLWVCMIWWEMLLWLPCLNAYLVISPLHIFKRTNTEQINRTMACQN